MCGVLDMVRVGWVHSALHTSCDYGVGGWRDGGRGDVGGVGVCVINALCVIILCIYTMYFYD